jgi:hypothetical protein
MQPRLGFPCGWLCCEIVPIPLTLHSILSHTFGPSNPSYPLFDIRFYRMSVCSCPCGCGCVWVCIFFQVVEVILPLSRESGADRALPVLPVWCLSSLTPLPLYLNRLSCVQMRLCVSCFFRKRSLPSILLSCVCRCPRGVQGERRPLPAHPHRHVQGQLHQSRTPQDRRPLEPSMVRKKVLDCREGGRRGSEGGGVGEGEGKTRSMDARYGRGA